MRTWGSLLCTRSRVRPLWPGRAFPKPQADASRAAPPSEPGPGTLSLPRQAREEQGPGEESQVSPYTVGPDYVPTRSGNKDSNRVRCHQRANRVGGARTVYFVSLELFPNKKLKKKTLVKARLSNSTSFYIRGGPRAEGEKRRRNRTRPRREASGDGRRRGRRGGRAALGSARSAGPEGLRAGCRCPRAGRFRPTPAPTCPCGPEPQMPTKGTGAALLWPGKGCVGRHACADRL